MLRHRCKGATKQQFNKEVRWGFVGRCQQRDNEIEIELERGYVDGVCKGNQISADVDERVQRLMEQMSKVLPVETVECHMGPTAAAGAATKQPLSLTVTSAVTTQQIHHKY